MARVSCTFCGRKVKLPDYVVRASVRCPGCSQCFDVDRLACDTSEPKWSAVVVSSVAAPTPPQTTSENVPPRLTSPHRCDQCRKPIDAATGLRKTTIVCPTCDQRTSIYAVIYACRSCGIRLETPTRLTGFPTTCPACNCQQTVPSDVLLTTLPNPPDSAWFGLYCPNCTGHLVANKQDVGASSVCPLCLVVLQVPHGGHYLEGTIRQSTLDPLSSLQVSKEGRCDGCQARIPMRGEACPYCGRESTLSEES